MAVVATAAIAAVIRSTTIDVVRFKTVVEYEKVDDGDDDDSSYVAKPLISPVTIWIGVSPDTTSPTTAHSAAADVLAVLKDYEIIDVDVDFRQSNYTREVGPRLHRPVGDLDPLLDAVDPITSSLGLCISPRARLGAQGTMALSLAEGGDSVKLLGLSSRHVLISSKDTNIDYVYHPNGLARDVVQLGRNAFTTLIDSIKLRISRHAIAIEREQGADVTDVARVRARDDRLKTQQLVDAASTAMNALGELLQEVNQDWSQPNNRVLGHVLRSPAVSLGVGLHRFTEDYGIFQINRDKLGDDFVVILNYDNKSEGFSLPGDSGSIIADIRGRIGGMLTGGSGKTESSDLTYATPF